MTELSLKISRIIDAPMEVIFNAWLDPKIFVEFMLPVEGVVVSDVKIDACEGGKFSLMMHVDGKDLPHGGEYKVIKKYSQIVFSWVSPFSVDNSIVTLNLSDLDGRTEIELSQVKFLDEEARDSHKACWVTILDCLNNTIID